MSNATSILVLIILMFGTNYYSYQSGHTKGMSDQAISMANVSNEVADTIHKLNEEVRHEVGRLSPAAVDDKLAGMFSVSKGESTSEDDDSITKFESMCALCAATLQPERRLAEPADAPMGASVYGGTRGLASPPTFFEDPVGEDAGAVGLSSME